MTVYGDYDVDGATSAALLIRLLRSLGVEAQYYIPDRLLEGYGPSAEALVRLGNEGSSLIVTVDCGAMARAIMGAGGGMGGRICQCLIGIVGAFDAAAIAALSAAL